jgi:hypothetical protein
MADTKISALAAVGSVAGTNEFAVNEAGTSKKATGTQIAAFCSPAAADATAGIAEIADQTEMEAGSDTGRIVTPGRQHFHPSAVKFWVKATGNATTIEVSYNMTSWADTGPGIADGTIATDFSSIDWCGQVAMLGAATNWNTTNTSGCGFSTQAAGTFTVTASQMTEGGTAAANPLDPVAWFVEGFGDL